MTSQAPAVGRSINQAIWESEMEKYHPSQKDLKFGVGVRLSQEPLKPAVHMLTQSRRCQFLGVADSQSV